MQFTFRYEQLDHSPALEDRVREKMQWASRLLESYDTGDGIMVNTDFERATAHHHGDVYTLRITLDLPSIGESLSADATGDDLYQLVETVQGTLHTAASRFKEHDVARRHAGS